MSLLMERCIEQTSVARLVIDRTFVQRKSDRMPVPPHVQMGSRNKPIRLINQHLYHPSPNRSDRNIYNRFSSIRVVSLKNRFRSNEREKAKQGEYRHVLISKPNYNPVFWWIILAFILSDQSASRLVVRLPLTATTPFSLVPLRVRLVLRKLDASHDNTTRLIGNSMTILQQTHGETNASFDNTEVSFFLHEENNYTLRLRRRWLV